MMRMLLELHKNPLVIHMFLAFVVHGEVGENRPQGMRVEKMTVRESRNFQPISLLRDQKLLPTLQLSKNPAEMVHLFENWVLQTSLHISTWVTDASVGQGYWKTIMYEARKNHADWSKMTPAERAGNLGVLGMHFSVLQVPDTHSILEATLRAELLEKIPGWLRQQCLLLGALSSHSIVVLVMRSVLLVESHARIESLKEIEKPLTPATNYTEAVKRLREWVRNIGVATVQLEARPDPQRLLDSMWGLLGNLLRDQLFASDVRDMVCVTRIREGCIVEKLFQFVILLEAQLVSRTQQDPIKSSSIRHPSRPPRCMHQTHMNPKERVRRRVVMAKMERTDWEGVSRIQLAAHQVKECQKPSKPKGNSKGKDGKNGGQNSGTKGGNGKEKGPGKGKNQDGQSANMNSSESSSKVEAAALVFKTSKKAWSISVSATNSYDQFDPTFVLVDSGAATHILLHMT
eukprot:1507273-Amphidinium_carterae.1